MSLRISPRPKASERAGVGERRRERRGEPHVLVREPGRHVRVGADLAQPVAQRLERAHQVLEPADRGAAGERQLERALGGPHRVERRDELERHRDRARDLGQVLERVGPRARGVGAVVEDADALQPRGRAERHRQQRGEAALGAIERLAQVEVLGGEGEGRLRAARRVLDHVPQRRRARRAPARPRGRAARPRAAAARAAAPRRRRGRRPRCEPCARARARAPPRASCPRAGPARRSWCGAGRRGAGARRRAPRAAP